MLIAADINFSSATSFRKRKCYPLTKLWDHFVASAKIRRNYQEIRRNGKPKISQKKTSVKRAGYQNVQASESPALTPGERGHTRNK